MVKKGPKVKIMGILIKNLVYGSFLTIFDQKNPNFQNRKKHFLFMSQGPPIPEIMFPSQKL